MIFYFFRIGDFVIEQKPYKLKNHVQNYEWGTKGMNAFIPKFIGIEPDDKSYAELWIGAHSALPSEIKVNDKSISLLEAIEKNPTEILGEKVCKNFYNKLPYLLKILSAERVLSIQAHPNKSQAIQLHSKIPEHYPDDNHKPEIAIALDSLTALVGFKTHNEICDALNMYPPLVDYIGIDDCNQFINSDKDDERGSLKNIFKKLMLNSVKNIESLKISINSLLSKFSDEINSEEEKLFIELFDIYGYDVGLLSIFFLNLVHLNQGEAIFTEAGIPHAYLKGNIVECMANSDNVVRAGLTNKYKDIETLLKILTYESGNVDLIGEQINENVKLYSPPIDEFKIQMIELPITGMEFKTDNKVELLLVISGEITLVNQEEKIIYRRGNAVLIPAIVSDYSIFIDKEASIIRVLVPID